MGFDFVNVNFRNFWETFKKSEKNLDQFGKCEKVLWSWKKVRGDFRMYGKVWEFLRKTVFLLEFGKVWEGVGKSEKAQERFTTIKKICLRQFDNLCEWLRESEKDGESMSLLEKVLKGFWNCEKLLVVWRKF